MQHKSFRRPESESDPGLEVVGSIDDIGYWAPTVQQMRDCILRHHVVAMSLPELPLAARMFVPSQTEVEAVNEMCLEAVNAGRVIDFGMLPNEVIKQGGNRGGPLWNKRAIGLPFRDPWLLYHRWESGTGIYLVNLLDYDTPAGGDVEVCELQPVANGPSRVLVICDRVMLQNEPDGADWPDRKYRAAVAPSPLRYLEGEGMSEAMNNGGTPESAAAGNVGDPLMTALLILSTRNVARETIKAPEKLNRARMKSGKAPIPPYDRIDTAGYVTAILARGARRERGEDRGGHHASPIPHIRMGHMRNYQSGQQSFIRDTLVNVSADARAEFLRSRSHYTAQP